MERQYALKPYTELRVLVPCSRGKEHTLTVTLLPKEKEEEEAVAKDPKQNTNSCEVNGSELLVNTPYEFDGGRSVGFFTHTGCTLRVRGSPKVLSECYASCSTVYRRSLFDIHQFVNTKRKRAQSERNPANRLGPRVLIVGGESTGKTTAAHTLVNYGARLGFHPLLLDLGAVETTQSMKLYCVQKPLDPVDGLMFVPHLNYMVGSTDLWANFALLKHLITSAMEEVEGRCGRFERTLLGGLVIDCPPLRLADESALGPTTTGVKEDEAIAFLQHLITECAIDILVTIGCDKLRALVRKNFAIKAFEARGGTLDDKLEEQMRNDYDEQQRQQQMDAEFRQELVFDEATGTLSSVVPSSAGAEQSRGGGAGQGTAALPAGDYPFPDKNRFVFELATTSVTTVATSVSSSSAVSAGNQLRMICMEPMAGAQVWFPHEKDYLFHDYWLKYFFGTGGSKFASNVIDIPANENKFLKLSAVSAASMAGLLPIDHDEDAISTANVNFLYDHELLQLTNHLIALSSATFKYTMNKKIMTAPTMAMCPFVEFHHIRLWSVRLIVLNVCADWVN